MKKAFLIIFLPALIVVGGLGSYLLLDSSPIVPVVPKCGLSIGDTLAKGGVEKFADSSWKIYRYGGNYADPSVNVLVYSDDVASEVGGRPGCELSVVDLPPKNAPGTDWRIGKVATDLSPFLGKIVRATFMLKSDVTLELPSGTVYLHDGKNVIQTPVQRLDKTWKTVQVVAEIPNEATAMELWFRLFLGAPALSPRDPKLFVSAEIDLASREDLASYQAGTAGHNQVGAVVHSEADNFGPFSSATCPVVASQAFLDAAGAGYKDNKWRIYRWSGESKAPDVNVSLLPNAGPNGETACRLSFVNGPETPRKGIDWRIGNISPHHGLKGKTVTFSVDLRSDRKIQFGNSYIYSYFGGPIGSDGIKELGQNWITKNVTMDVKENVTTAEFWYRLVLGNSTIIPGNGVIEFIPKLRIEE